MPTAPRFPRERAALRRAWLGRGGSAPGPRSLRDGSRKLGETTRRALGLPTLPSRSDPLRPLCPPRSPPPRRGLAPPSTPPPGPTSVWLYWGRFSAQPALAVVFCSLHTMPARHGGPRVHSNNASRGAGRACAGLGHCGSLRARGACLLRSSAFRNAYIIRLCVSGGGGSGRSDSVPAFPRPWLLGGSKDPPHLRFVVILMGWVGAQVSCVVRVFFFFFFF